MPTLPSGRHVAVCYSPRFHSWMKAVGRRQLRQFLCLETPAHVYPWLRVMYLVPDEKGQPPSEEYFHPRSSPCPARHHMVYSGFTLNQWDSLTRDWSEEDKVAMRIWVETAVQREVIDPIIGQTTKAR